MISRKLLDKNKPSAELMSAFWCVTVAQIRNAMPHSNARQEAVSKRMDAFTKFTVARRPDLRRIARHTQGEHSVEDVVNEAWLLAAHLWERGDIAADFGDTAFQQRLLAHLYQKLVRYTERNIRHALRLDHPTRDESTTPLIDRLADAGTDPLSTAIAAQECPSSRNDTVFSLAVAYLFLLRRFNNRMRALANHLLISLSHAYRCCARARWLVAQQHSLPWKPSDAKTALRPWRTFRARHTPRQLELEFGPAMPLFAHAISPLPA
jgi:hypothetical protein